MTHWHNLPQLSLNLPSRHYEYISLSSDIKSGVYYSMVLFNHVFKEAYSNLCMKIHLTSKLTQYLTNIFKMRFLMRNSIKYSQQCQNGIFEQNMSCNNGTLTNYMDLPLYIIYTLKYRDSPITDADKHALRPCYSLDLKIGT